MSYVRRERYLWRHVRYTHGNYRAWCLIDHAERVAKMYEYRDCVRIPTTEDEIRDHRLISLL